MYTGHHIGQFGSVCKINEIDIMWVFTLLNIRWPNMMSNIQLNTRATTKPITQEVHMHMWNTPTQGCPKRDTVKEAEPTRPREDKWKER